MTVPPPCGSFFSLLLPHALALLGSAVYPRGRTLNPGSTMTVSTQFRLLPQVASGAALFYISFRLSPEIRLLLTHMLELSAHDPHLRAGMYVRAGMYLRA